MAGVEAHVCATVRVHLCGALTSGAALAVARAVGGTVVVWVSPSLMVGGGVKAPYTPDPGVLWLGSCNPFTAMGTATIAPSAAMPDIAPILVLLLWAIAFATPFLLILPKLQIHPKPMGGQRRKNRLI